MLLPAPMLQTIAMFLPLPPLWEKRIRILNDWTSCECPNEAVVCALDIIDENPRICWILIGMWCRKNTGTESTSNMEWLEPKHQINQSRVEWSDSDHWSYVLSYGNLSFATSHTARWKQNPTICELRWMAGYLSVLSQNQLHTTIVTIQTEESYDIEPEFIKRLIAIADVASICRQCCTNVSFVRWQRSTPLHWIWCQYRIGHCFSGGWFELLVLHIRRCGSQRRRLRW